MRFALLIALLAALLPASAHPEPTVFLVRHAEKAADKSGHNDPDLSEAGRARAEKLAQQLKDADIKAIFVTEFKRTQETAAPLARALGLKPVVIPASDRESLLSRLRTLQGNALVIAHGNTIPDLIRALRIADVVKIGEQDYDNLFEVLLGPQPQLVRLHQPN